MSKYYFNNLARLIALWLFVGFSTLAVAQTVFTGANDSRWFDAGNWSAGLPANGNPATIPGGAVVTIDEVLNANFNVANFGAVTATAGINVRKEWSNSGDFVTTSRINVYGTLNNFGSLEAQGEGTVLVTPTGSIASNGAIEFEKWIIVRGQLRNEGTIDVPTGAIINIDDDGTFDNPGVIDVVGRLQFLDRTVYSAPSGGTINVLAGGLVQVLGESQVNNAGIIRVANNGRFLQKATLNNNPGRMFVDGELRTFANSVTSVNFLTIMENGALRIDDAEEFTVAFSLVNQGIVNIARPVTVRGLITNEDSGSFTVRGTGSLDFVAGTNLNNKGSFLNQGLITTTGTITNDKWFTNRGTIRQNNGGSLINNRTFRNEALLENINRIVNNLTFFNDGRMTNGSGGTIENNENFINLQDAHIENLFVITNKRYLKNEGFFENGVSLINEDVFDNFGFLSNVGDITNTADARIANRPSGVIDNSLSGIFTNDGSIFNEGEINIFDCGVFVNNGSINNPSWITNDGIFYQNGTLTGKAIMGNGPVVAEGGTSPLICQPWTQKVDQNGRTRVSATRFAKAPFDSCTALQYLIDGEESQDYTCADIGSREVTITLVDRKGNRISCKTTLTITDEFAPRVSTCPGDINLTEVESTPTVVTWTAPTFTDNCDKDVRVVSNFNPGDRFPEGSTVVTYTATDDSGNEFVCEFTVTITPKAVCQPKADKGLLVYYNMTRGVGSYIYDRAGFGHRWHARIEQPNDIKWTGETGLVGNGHGIVRTGANGKSIGERLQMTNALTVEAWVRADKLQHGPARVVTYSENVLKRNFTLGQEGDRWVFRLKTTHTNDNGLPNRAARAGSVKVGQLQHVVFTRYADGQERLYVDGERQYTGQVGGNFSNWGTHCKIALFNEMTLDRGFAGLIKNVAVYDRPLTHDEILASRARGVCETGDDSPLGQICQGERGEVSFERWDNIGGGDLPWLYKNTRYPHDPSSTSTLHDAAIPFNAGDNYATRTRGWIYPSKTGKHRFAVSGDDQTRLIISPVADDAGFGYTFGYISGWTNWGQLDKYASQQSNEVHLVAGKGYFFELQQKEGHGGDHAAIFWKQPGSGSFELIRSANLGNIEKCEVPAPEECAGAKGGLLREVWTGINSSDIWELLADPRYPNSPTSRNVINSFASPVGIGDAYGTRVRGYIHPTVTGDYHFTVTGDNQTKLMISTDASPDNSRAVAELNGWTGQHEFNKYPTQNSQAIRLVAGQRYYVELLHQEGQGGDFFKVFWRTPTNNNRHVIPGANLSTYVECGQAPTQATCNRDILFVVGNTHLNNGDAAVKRRLESRGYTVQVRAAKETQANHAAGKGLVIVSSTTNSGDLAGRLRDVRVPVLVWEAYLYDDMRMTANSANVDYGFRTSDDIILTGANPLTGNRTGRQRIFTQHRGTVWGKVMGTDATVLATHPADPWMASLFYYEAGQRMAGGINAPALRIGFFLDNESAANLTSYGQQVFDRVIDFATDCTGTAGARRTADVLTLDADKQLDAVELRWTSNTAFKDEGYLVERSTDDVNYFVIGEVAPQGQGEDMNTFTFVDADPSVGQNYYRVTAVYTDGTDRQSELRLVDYAAIGNATVFPNPATDVATVSLQGFEEHEVTISVSDALGRRITSQVVPAGTPSARLAVADLPEGWYAVTVQTGDFKTVKRLVVTRE